MITYQGSNRFVWVFTLSKPTLTLSDGWRLFFLASPRSWIIKQDQRAPLFVKDGRYSDSPCLTGFALPKDVRGLLNKAPALCIKSKETLSRPNTSFPLSSPMPFCPERQTPAEVSLLALDSSVWPSADGFSPSGNSVRLGLTHLTCCKNGHKPTLPLRWNLFFSLLMSKNAASSINQCFFSDKR